MYTFWKLYIVFFVCQESHVTSQMSIVICHLQNTFTAKLLELGSWNFDRSFTSPNFWHMICHVSFVTCHKLRVTSHVSGEVSYSIYLHGQTVRAGELKFLQKVHLPQPVMCHVSQVWCHESCVMSFVSYIIFQMPSQTNGDVWHMPGWRKWTFCRAHIAIRSDLIRRAVHPLTLGPKITNKYVIINMQYYKFKSQLLLRDHEEKFLASQSHLLAPAAAFVCR